MCAKRIKNSLKIEFSGVCCYTHLLHGGIFVLAKCATTVDEYRYSSPVTQYSVHTVTVSTRKTFMKLLRVKFAVQPNTSQPHMFSSLHKLTKNI
jgi:hypothetical protein